MYVCEGRAKICFCIQDAVMDFGLRTKYSSYIHTMCLCLLKKRKEKKRKGKNTLVIHSLASSLKPSAFHRIQKPVRILLMTILILNRVAVMLCLGKKVVVGSRLKFSALQVNKDCGCG